MPRSTARAGTKTSTKTETKTTAKAKKKSNGAAAAAAPVASRRSNVSNNSNGNAQEAGDATVGHEQIAHRAYEIWLEQGRPSGQRDQHWFEAERQMRATG